MSRRARLAPSLNNGSASAAVSAAKESKKFAQYIAGLLSAANVLQHGMGTKKTPFAWDMHQLRRHAEAGESLCHYDSGPLPTAAAPLNPSVPAAAGAAAAAETAVASAAVLNEEYSPWAHKRYSDADAVRDVIKRLCVDAPGITTKQHLVMVGDEITRVIPGFAQW